MSSERMSEFPALKFLELFAVVWIRICDYFLPSLKAPLWIRIGNTAFMATQKNRKNNRVALFLWMDIPGSNLFQLLFNILLNQHTPLPLSLSLSLSLSWCEKEQLFPYSNKY